MVVASQVNCQRSCGGARKNSSSNDIYSGYPALLQHSNRLSSLLVSFGDPDGGIDPLVTVPIASSKKWSPNEPLPVINQWFAPVPPGEWQAEPAHFELMMDSSWPLLLLKVAPVKVEQSKAKVSDLQEMAINSIRIAV